MRLASGLVVALMVVALAGCSVSDVGPINQMTKGVQPPSNVYIPDPGDDGSTVVGLAFSGGGTRAAAFAYGVLRELDATLIDEHPRRRTMVDDIRMISGASGGAVAAAYFGYKGPEGYADFRERFLLQNAEANMNESALSPVNLARAYGGGVNGLNTFGRWLDDNLFDGATFEAFRTVDRPIVWIHASDIYNGTPFLFNHDTFAALCSDLDKTKIAHAVAASAAVPVVFAPVVVSATDPDCAYQRPAWLDQALGDPEAPLRLKAYAMALRSYQKADKLNYVKLLDGGLTDNIGVTGMAVHRASSATPYGPLSPGEAVKLRKLFFIVVDAGHTNDVDWATKLEGPKLGPLLSAVTTAGIAAAVRNEFDALKLQTAAWRQAMVVYRCGLSRSAVLSLRGTLAGWDCRDVELVVEHISFGDLGPAMEARLNAIPTRLRLPGDHIDLAITAGREALRVNAAYQRTVAAIRRFSGVNGTNAVAQSD